MSGLKYPFKRQRLSEWRKKTKAQLYAVNRRYTLATVIQIDWKKRMRKDISCNCNLKKAGLVIVILDKIVFKQGYQRARGTSYNDKRVDSSGIYNDYKYTCS